MYIIYFLIHKLYTKEFFFMQFIHVADIHASRERLPQTLHILKSLKDRSESGDIDFILFAGDFWDSTITATKGSGFSDIISAIKELEKNTRLFFIYGTPSHEPLGSLDAFKSDRTKVFSKFSIEELCVAGKAVKIVLIPEPRRGDFISDSVEKTNNAINKYLDDIISVAKKETAGFNTVVVYHGEVKGAVYQNGTYASSPTAISKEKLVFLGADYYAMGHIHLPQEVFRNAYYSGSASPKNFGETHDGSYNLVAIKDNGVKVEKISFGLPVYQTIQVDDIKKISISGDFSDRHIRIQTECSREDKKSLDIRALSDGIKKRTNALSVKFEISISENKNISESNISRQKTITEKLIEYAKENALAIPDGAVEITEDIRQNTLIKFAYPQHSFELISLSLRGAIGIRDGQHKENFDIDFSKFDDGVVCLLGANGTGKTTIIENCHPYPCMLTRNDSLRENFYLKDSHRILVYKDENGTFYRISMLIDGKTATGKVSYFAETSKDMRNWSCIPDTDGSLASYQNWADTTFGSIDIFLRTAFFAKEQTKNVPDIASTTKGERMELLSKLAGVEHLKEVSAIAKEKRKELEDSAEKLEIEIGSYSKYEEIIESNKQDIISWRKSLELQKEIIKKLRNQVAVLKEKDAVFQTQKLVIQTNRLLKDQYTNELAVIRQELEIIRKGLESVDIFKKADDFKNQKDICQKEIDKRQDEISDISAEISVNTKKQNKLNKEFTKISVALSDYKAQIPEINTVCPTCGALLSENKKKELESIVCHNKKQAQELENKRYAVESELQQINKSITDNEKKLIDIQDSVVELKRKKQEYEDFLLKNQGLLNLIPDYDHNKLVLKEKENSEKVLELQEKLDGIGLGEIPEDVSDELNRIELKLQSEVNKESELTASINAAEKENRRYNDELVKKEQEECLLKRINSKIKACLFIENAFSNNGIPAVELRNSAPEIAEITNRILSESYGNKFEIRFGSTSELKQKRKANEDFNIIVYDIENGDEKTIDLVSSGERIWIKQALFYAFSIVQMNRTGFNFRTRLIDESDGSLDGTLRPKYLQMVTAAHKNANARLTMLITHSQEIKDIAQQVIEI